MSAGQIKAIKRAELNKLDFFSSPLTQVIFGRDWNSKDLGEQSPSTERKCTAREVRLRPDGRVDTIYLRTPRANESREEMTDKTELVNAGSPDATQDLATPRQEGLRGSVEQSANKTGRLDASLNASQDLTLLKRVTHEIAKIDRKANLKTLSD